MMILAIDTSRGVTSLALGSNGKVISSLHDDTPNQQAGGLIAQIDALLQQADSALNDIQLITTTTGPGGFTSVRIGIAAARGLAFASGIPCHGVASLELMAYYAAKQLKEGEPFECLIPAGRKDHAFQRFELTQGRAVATAPMALRRNDAINHAIARCSTQEALGNILMQADAFAPTLLHYMHNHTITDFIKPTPLYIRAPDAIAAKPFLKNALSS